MYAITGGGGGSGSHGREVIEQVGAAAQAGVDMIQLREPALEARALYELCLAARAAVGRRPTLLLLNRRVDVALAAKLDGVHLPAHGLPPAAVRTWTGPGFWLGVSCHNLAEVDAAAADGCDFCVFGPVFASPGKGPPVGLAALAEAARRTLPVLALGGVTSANAGLCLAQGAAGVAGIRLFSPAEAAASVDSLRNRQPAKCVE